MGNEIKDNEHLDSRGLPEDWIGQHNIGSRLMVISVIAAFLYTFFLPLPVGYAEIISYVVMFVFLIITFGINSLKHLVSIVKYWRQK